VDGYEWNTCDDITATELDPAGDLDGYTLIAGVLYDKDGNEAEPTRPTWPATVDGIREALTVLGKHKYAVAQTLGVFGHYGSRTDGSRNPLALYLAAVVDGARSATIVADGYEVTTGDGVVEGGLPEAVFEFGIGFCNEGAFGWLEDAGADRPVPLTTPCHARS
jgi:hypothetical protein